MTKSQLCVKQICLPSIISVLTNNKKELWKTVSLTSFQKPPNAIRFNFLLQVYPSVLPLYLLLFIRPVHTARIRLCLKMKIFFPLVWPIVHPCQVKTVSENASFQIALQSRNFRKRRLLDSCRWRKNEYVEVLDPRSYPAHEMRRNAHAPIKEGTTFSHYCIVVCRGKNDSKTQREKKSGEKNLHFQTKTDTCERGLTG